MMPFTAAKLGAVASMMSMRCRARRAMRRTAHCRPRLLIAILEGDVRERIREGKMTVVNIHDRPEQAQRAVTPFCQLWDSL
jgi:hypothetical protein